MKRILLSISLILTSYSFVSAQVLGNSIVTWDFADGLPAGWETGISSTNNTAHWEYRGPETVPDNTVCSRGSCGGASQPINSLTKSNGFMIFDSNYWDDDGNDCGQLGTGPDPGPHNAWMMTNSIDLSMYDHVVLTFQQQYRHYQTTQTKVEVSVNHGAWVQVAANFGQALQSPVVQWKTTDISTLVGGQSDVRIRFSFVGFYYWWLLDDITLYTPNENDIMIDWVGYTSNPLGLEEPISSNLQYDQYPVVMIPPFTFQSKATNIGWNSQTNVRLNTIIIKDDNEETYDQDSPSQTLSPGISNIFQITPNYTNPTTVGSYKIKYEILQDEVDEAFANNLDSLDYSISPFTYARDEGPMEDSYEATGLYLGQKFEIGNVFQIFNSGKQCHSIQVAIAEGTQPGTEIRGYIYIAYTDTLVAQTAKYTVNSADLNSPGQEKIVTLHFSSNVSLTNGKYYFVSVGAVSGVQQAKIARSGQSPQETSLIVFREVNATFYSLKTPVVRMNIFNTGIKSGCTDPTAMNYVSTATVDDGSCRYPGCTDPTATNYNPDANFENGTCVIAGCMDPLADNYNPNATVDDGNCIFYGCIDEEANNYNPEANTDDGSCEYDGCTNPLADNYNPHATVDDGSCIISGCMDENANNYNPDANTEDGSCIYPGCTDEEADNYNPGANEDDGSCEYSGCTNPLADNYNPQATIDDGSCIISGCMDEGADNYNPDANQDDGSCVISGCMDDTALNYNPEANQDDGSCVYPEINIDVPITSGCAPFELTVINQTVFLDGATCTYKLNDEIIYTECSPNFSYMIESAGTYQLQYIYELDNFVSEINVEIVVSAAPEQPLISYDSENFTVNCSNCSAYESGWSRDGVLLGNEDGNSMSIFSESVYHNGVYSVQIIDSENGCSSTSEDLFVLQPYFEIDEIGGCVPFKVIVTNNTDPVSGIDYSMDYGNGYVNDSFTTSEAYEYTEEGTFEITLTATAPLGSGTYSRTVTAYPIIIPILEHNIDEGLVICQNCDLFETVIWNIDGNSYYDIDSHSDDGADYTVNGVTEFGCEGSASMILTSVENLVALKEQYIVYPNPSNEYVWVKGKSQKTFTVELVDFTGKIVYQSGEALSAHRIDTRNILAGIYFVKTVNASGISVQRISVVH